MKDEDLVQARQEKLLNIVTLHEKWLKHEPDGKMACFKNMDLKRCNFSGLNLAGVDFSQAKVGSADFSGCNLTGCNFTDAHASYANFSDADLSGVIANRANFTSAQFVNARLNDSILRDSTFDKCSFVDADMFQADCTGISGKNINCKGANLERVNFYTANLFGAYLVSANVKNLCICNTNIQRARINDSFLQISLSFGTLGFHLEEEKLYYSFPYLSNFNGSTISDFLEAFVDIYPEENPENTRIIREVKWAISCFSHVESE